MAREGGRKEGRSALLLFVRLAIMNKDQFLCQLFLCLCTYICTYIAERQPTSCSAASLHHPIPIFSHSLPIFRRTCFESFEKGLAWRLECQRLKRLCHLTCDHSHSHSHWHWHWQDDRVHLHLSRDEVTWVSWVKANCQCLSKIKESSKTAGLVCYMKMHFALPGQVKNRLPLRGQQWGGQSFQKLTLTWVDRTRREARWKCWLRKESMRQVLRKHKQQQGHRRQQLCFVSEAQRRTKRAWLVRFLRRGRMIRDERDPDSVVVGPSLVT